MDCQNWEPVVVGRPKPTQKPGRIAPAGSTVRRLEEDELPVLKKILGPEMRQKMIGARVARGWNQQQLATQCALPASVIRDIETGRVVPTGAQLNTLNRLLGGGLRLEERK